MDAFFLSQINRAFLPRYRPNIDWYALKGMLWQEAQAACQDLGVYLVEPRSAHKEADLEGVAEVKTLLFLSLTI